MLKGYQIWRLFTGTIAFTAIWWRYLWLIAFLVPIALHLERLEGAKSAIITYFAAGAFSALSWCVGVTIYGNPSLGTGWESWVPTTGALSALVAICLARTGPFSSVRLTGRIVIPIWGIGLIYLIVDVNAPVTDWLIVIPVHVAAGLFVLLRLLLLPNVPRGVPFAYQAAARAERPSTSPSAKPKPDSGQLPRPPAGFDPVVDEILKKISLNGTESLSPGEREILREAGRRFHEGQG